jgi:hypothetical protein
MMVSITNKSVTACSLMVLIICLFFPLSVCSQEDPGLDEILNGFENDQKPNDELQKAPDGFEDAPGEKKSPEELAEDEILEGFEDETKEAAALDAEKGSLPDWLSIDGYFKISSVYSYLSHDAAGTDTNWHGLTRLRSELKLELDADLSENWRARVSGHGFYDFAYTINGRDNFTDDVLDNHEKELEFDEVYLQGSLTNDLDLKAGRQIVVWGRSDNIRITDVLNPLDLRWPGLVDIEKLRLPLTMTKLDYYIKGWSLSGVVLHEVRYNRNPEFGSDFFPGLQPLPGKESPREGFAIDNTQFAASLNGIFQGVGYLILSCGYLCSKRVYFTDFSLSGSPIRNKASPHKNARWGLQHCPGKLAFQNRRSLFRWFRIFQHTGQRVFQIGWTGRSRILRHFGCDHHPGHCPPALF